MSASDVPGAVSAGQTDALADKLGIKLAARDLSTPSKLYFLISDIIYLQGDSISDRAYYFTQPTYCTQGKFIIMSYPEIVPLADSLPHSPHCHFLRGYCPWKPHQKSEDTKCNNHIADAYS